MTATDDNIAASTVAGWAANDPDTATAHIDRIAYREHNPDSADGADGVRDYLRQRAEQGGARTAVRVLGDGPYVVAQFDNPEANHATSFDVFKFDHDALVEHWSFWAAAARPNRSGHTPLDGPTTPNPAVSTRESRALVERYYQTVHIGGQHDKAREYFTGNHCVRHEPGVTDGVTAFLADLNVLTRDRTIDKVEILVAQHDLVFLVARGTHQHRPCNYLDLYRVEAGTLAEHWGFFHEEPPPTEHKNRNGVL